MRIEQVQITFQRTIRVPDGRSPTSLPPGLGAFPTYMVADYRANCPDLWEDDGVFVPMHAREAMWISFTLAGDSPRALLVGAGNVNAVTGEKLTARLAWPQNYVVLPIQPWLDGWKDTDGVIYQFVATRYEGGDGLTVGEQVLGEDSRTGGIGIAVFKPKDPDLKSQSPFHEYVTGGPYDFMPMAYSCSGETPSMAMVADMSLACSVSFDEMGLGRGGRIKQKVYPDPFVTDGKTVEDVWQAEPASSMAVYLVAAEAFSEITGLKVPDMPQAFEKYQGPWFDLPDQEYGDAKGSEVFSGLKSVFAEE